MIAWITREIGTGPYDRVVVGPDTVKIDVRDMLDRGGNPVDLVREKISDGLAHLGKGKRVVVCCEYGESRSKAVAMGLLSRYENISFHAAVQRVVAASGAKNVRMEVLETVRKAVEGDRRGGGGNDAGSILVTGGRGFLGGAVLKELQRAHGESRVVKSDMDLTGDAAVLGIAAVRDGVGVVVHMAHPRMCTTNASMGAAVAMLKNVLDVCREYDLRLVYPSSIEVFNGRRDLAGPVPEEEAPMPGGTFGLAKHVCEEMIGAYAAVYGVRALILRLPKLYGPPDRPAFLTGFIRKARQGAPITTHRYANGSPGLDLLHQEDAARGVAAVALSDQTGILHAGSGKTVTTAEIASMVTAEVGSSSIIHELEIDGNASTIYLDISKIEQRVGWSPALSLESGIRSLVRDEIVA